MKRKREITDGLRSLFPEKEIYRILSLGDDERL